MSGKQYIIIAKLREYINRHPRLKRFHGYWFLVLTLAKRDIISRYRRSTLKILWAVLDPLFYMLIFGIIRSFLGISSGEMPYLIFLFSGLIPWTLFSHIVNTCPNSVINNASIMKKNPLPRELFPMVAATTALFDFSMSILIMFFMMIIFHVPFTIHLLWLPFLIGIVVILGIGVGFWITAYGVFRRDIIRASNYFFQIFFYLSPIFYPLDRVPPSLLTIYKLNPFVGILESFRNVLGSGTMPNFQFLLFSLPVTAIIFISGFNIYRKRSLFFADYL